MFEVPQDKEETKTMRVLLGLAVVVVLVGFVSIISDVFMRGMLHGGRRDNDNKAGNILMIIGIIFMILAPLFAMLIQLAISRKREFLADATGALLSRYPEGLASALVKISKVATPMQRQSSAIAHLYIADPKGGGFGKKVRGLFATHPRVEDRVRALTGK